MFETEDLNLPAKDDPGFRKALIQLDKALAEECKFDPNCQILHKRLLDLGGHHVKHDACPLTVQNILARGQRWDGKHAILLLRECWQCHRNSAVYWHRSDETLRLATGYALGDDGLWRRHSWNVDALGVVVESTARREVYYGFVQTEAESIESYFANVLDEEVYNMFIQYQDLTLAARLEELEPPGLSCSPLPRPGFLPANCRYRGEARCGLPWRAFPGEPL